MTRDLAFALVSGLGLTLTTLWIAAVIRDWYLAECRRFDDLGRDRL